MDERLKKQLDFALEIDKEKNIFRQTHLSGHGRNENDAEHAWHMAIMAYLLREYSNEPVDITRVMLMCLIHDVVEIDAGDTYAYDEEGKKTQKAREEAAKERIYSLLPEDQKEELAAIFDEFEESKTSESKFAHAMDNLQPLMLNNSNDGGDWREHGVSAKQVYGRQSRTKEGSEKLYEVKEPDLAKCAKRKDFGQGFYLTTSKEQAESFLRTSIAKAIATGTIEEGQKFGYISTFEFNLSGNLETHIFENADVDWLHCIAAHRKKKMFIEVEREMARYDIIAGKIADDATNATLTAYLAGAFGTAGDKEADDFCIRQLLPNKLKDQYCFKTEAAIECLKFVKGEKIWLK